MPIEPGTTLPDATLLQIGAEGPESVALSDKTKGRKVVIFGLPGAYTGTCTTAHVPSFMRNMDALAAKGVDEVICLSVNDPFVMNEWGKQAGGDGKVMMLADWDASFAKALGVDADMSGAGLGCLLYTSDAADD